LFLLFIFGVEGYSTKKSPSHYCTLKKIKMVEKEEKKRKSIQVTLCTFFLLSRQFLACGVVRGESIPASLPSQLHLIVVKPQVKKK